MAAIYVEILIRAPLSEIWKFTQDPTIHQKWDLRFSTITYVPKTNVSAPQRFLYATRIGFGLSIAGEGESTGAHDLASGERVSNLKFWSDERLSLIREGAGYWKYIPTVEGVRFLTRYDYRTRFGLIGSIVDRCVFRPLMGWATAWSFDSLRLWLEDGVPPAAARVQAAAHALARIGLAGVFAWQGFAPKLFRVSADELILLRNAGIPAEGIGPALTLLGYGELGFAVLLLVLWRRAWPAALSILLMIAATASVALNSAHYLTAAFNPVSLNLSVVLLAAIDLLTLRNLPTAARCLRTPNLESRG